MEGVLRPDWSWHGHDVLNWRRRRFSWSNWNEAAEAQRLDQHPDSSAMSFPTRLEPATSVSFLTGEEEGTIGAVGMWRGGGRNRRRHR